MTIYLFRLMFVLFELFCVMYPLVRWLTLFVISRGIEMLAIIIIIFANLCSYDVIVAFDVTSQKLRSICYCNK